MRLEIDAVRKVYRGGVVALAGVTLTLEPGVLGLLGPNGAGKSTLMRILATLARPTSGRVLWNGADLTREPRKPAAPKTTKESVKSPASAGPAPQSTNAFVVAPRSSSGCWRPTARRWSSARWRASPARTTRSRP